MRAAAFALALVACSIPEKHFDNGSIDAPQGTIDANPNPPDGPPGGPDGPIGGAFDCMGQPFPTTGESTFTVSGVVAKLDGGTTIAGATVGGYVSGGGSPILTTTTDGSGNFSVTVSPPGSVAVDGYLKATATGVVDAYVYPQAPFSKDVMVGIETFTSPLSTEGLDPSTAQLVIEVHDCNGMPLANATVSLSPPGGQIQYVRNGTTDPTATATDSSGAAIVLDYPAGNPTLNATVNGIQLRPHTFPTTANSVATADIGP
jgi:hypothetical protein